MGHRGASVVSMAELSSTSQSAALPRMGAGCELDGIPPFVVAGDRCLEWPGLLDRDGYGRVHGASTYAAHRMIFELFVGPIRPGAFILHRCDNPSCVNPAHLYEGDHAQNMRDRDLRGRTITPAPLRKFDAETIRRVRENAGDWREFCAREGISRTHYFRLRQEARG